MRHVLAVCAFVVMFALGARAHAHGARFVGGHPIAVKYGGGFCYIDAPHLHAYAPDRPQLYQRVGDEFVFAADPTPFGYDGEKHPFYGNHPVVTIGAEPVICYLDGPHYHAFLPPSGPDYRVEKGVAFYVGPFPPAYVKVRPQRSRVVNAEYRPFLAQRPTIEVVPPPEWHGEVWAPSVEVHGPAVAVAAPGVVVAAPSVSVTAPRVVVSPPGLYVAPPRVAVSAPGVFVAGPGIAVEGGVYVEGGRGHHDRGKHKGWYKH